MSLCTTCDDATTCVGCVNGDHTLNAVSHLCECTASGFILLDNGNCYDTNDPVIPDECAGKPFILITDASCVVSCPSGMYPE